ncbi:MULTISPECIES: sigma 54-interacting transcriptional regulator [Brevibacillus]|uniref:Transcriptional regulator containing PAS, AAA-type ATPase, and DNA-binding Fis domains n=1 Tax=Brevibacillus centrosporus TaxID=54910 RepID=A0A1I4AVA8_9BACL|nr:MULTISPECIES: sigma 54-interacting transcriptional regulator [Brevibacillus]MEC2131187.1 sigma 54-interacting transcriptional regulator [Brevibacillus centrosporus]MED1792612.1 sigma 54-interacting transcriptional regulator [Brevibacillus nitrificans]RNB73030.1 AAA family ATPase [Brevibacillus centrosporus]SFK60140.1 Transcriptional regulator containing PAS, AAA-type ATPase, and DNA-binding Fis domains [Brevibacillus centrosporus]GED31737.1 Fis family transcriptional regulator [Brevibacillu
MEKRTVTFVAKMDEFLQSVVSQCHELGISEDIHIEAIRVDQLPFRPITPGSLVVLSTKSIVPQVESYVPPGSKLIVAKRMLPYHNLREMLEIPKGVKVLLVSDTAETAQENVELLRASGMDFEVYPYYPGADYPPDVEIAVTPGEAEHVPPHIRKVVDIGFRVIDLSTLLAIYAHFNSDNFQKVTARAMQSLIYITKELNKEIQHAHLLSKYLEAIVNRIEDAVIAFDESEIVRFVNQKAVDSLNLHGVDVVGEKSAVCLPPDFYEAIQQCEENEDVLVDWANKTYFFRKMHIVMEGSFLGSLILFRKAADIEKMEHEYRLRLYSKGLVAKYQFDDIYGASATFSQVIQIAKKIARSNSTVLLLGETGTGKELLAQAIHNASPRRREPFVGVNFAAISESLLESELFGYEEGAFTGARKGGHIGWFELAHKGTIFLDEIGDASGAIQNRLLRVLQERQIMRVGGSKVIPTDIRVIAATNQDLQQMVQEGTFRADLYYRLNILPIHLPPLRKRREDIPWLVEHFVKKYSFDLRRPPFTLSAEAMKALLDYDWPGNIRELENVVEYLAHIVDDEAYSCHLPFLREVTHTPLPSVVMDQECEAMIAEYGKRGFLEEMTAILQQLSQGGQGRYNLVEQLQESGLQVSSQQLRYRLKLLQQDELIHVGKGRQGSQISSKGEALLAYLKSSRS